MICQRCRAYTYTWETLSPFTAQLMALSSELFGMVFEDHVVRSMLVSRALVLKQARLATWVCINPSIYRSYQMDGAWRKFLAADGTRCHNSLRRSSIIYTRFVGNRAGQCGLQSKAGLQEWGHHFVVLPQSPVSNASRSRRVHR